MSNARQKHSNFMLKYGDGKHIDKLMRVDHSLEFPSGTGSSVDHIRQIMYPVVSQAVKNPYMSDKAAIKASTFPHEHTIYFMREYLRTNSHREIHPDVLTAIAKHNGHSESVRTTLANHKNMPKEAWAHLAVHTQNKVDERQKHAVDFSGPYVIERDHYLQKAQ
jgi:hypothetical protein